VLHVSIEEDDHWVFSTETSKDKQGKMLLLARSLKYYKICSTLKTEISNRISAT